MEQYSADSDSLSASRVDAASHRCAPASALPQVRTPQYISCPHPRFGRAETEKAAKSKSCCIDLYIHILPRHDGHTTPYGVLQGADHVSECES
jgi:hypothetical protein